MINFPKFLIAVIAFLVIFLWFKDGRILATGESAIPFANLPRYVEITENSWENFALGIYPGFTNASYLTYWFLNLFASIGIPSFLIEAGFFYSIFLVSGFSIYALTKEFFPKINTAAAVLAVVFYWFSPFALVNIWNRFLYNHMVFSAMLPFVILVFIKGIHQRKYINTVFFALSTVLFSYASTSPAFDILLWLTLLFISGLYIYWSKIWKERVFIVYYVLLSMGLYVIFNLWWISQMFSYSLSQQSVGTTQMFFNSEDNIYTLDVISSRLGNLTDIFRLMHHDYYYNSTNRIISLFSQKGVVITHFLLILFIWISVYKNLKNQAVVLCTILLLMAIFFMKGSLSPFGEVMSFLFQKIPTLQLFRNPFEKIGFLAAIFYSILFAFSSDKFLIRLFPGRHVWLLVALVTLIVGLPFFNKDLFNYSDSQGAQKNYEVVVPDFYAEANKWLSQQSGNFRILALPLDGEGINYNWPYPFTGVESTNTLLNIPSISYDTTVPYYSQISQQMQSGFLNDPYFLSKAKKLNIRYILIRRDFDFKERDMANPDIIENKMLELENKNLLKKKAQFGDLTFWEIQDWQDESVQVSQLVDTISPLQDFSFVGVGDGDRILVNDIPLFASFSKNNSYILPKESLFIEKEVNDSYFYDQNVFPYSSYIGQDFSYPGVILREKIESGLIFSKRKKLEYQLLHLGKRISEMNQSVVKKDPESFNISLHNYSNELISLKSLLTIVKPNLDNQFSSMKYYDIYVPLQRHRNFLKNIVDNEVQFSDKKKIAGVILQIDQFTKQFFISPLNKILSNEKFGIDYRNYYQFEIPLTGNYMLASKNLLNLPVDSNGEIMLQIDNKLEEKKYFIGADKRLTIPDLTFSEGIHELGLNYFVLEDLNLDKNIDLEMANKITFPINIDQEDTSVSVSFDYYIKKGAFSLKFQSSSDNDKTQNLPTKVINISSPGNGEIRHFYEHIDPRKNAFSSSLVFDFPSDTICQKNVSNKQISCGDYQISNIQIKKIIRLQPTLVQKNSELDSKSNLPLISYQKKNNSYYRIQIKNAESPYILTLSELYHSGWRMKIDNQVNYDHTLVNAYSNGWLVNKTGDYEIELTFEPNFYYQVTIVFSTAAITIVMIGVFTWYLKKKAIRS